MCVAAPIRMRQVHSRPGSRISSSRPAVGRILGVWICRKPLIPMRFFLKTDFAGKFSASRRRDAFPDREPKGGFGHSQKFGNHDMTLTRREFLTAAASLATMPMLGSGAQAAI